MYWFPNAVDVFGFPVEALWCTGFQRLLIYLAFLLMLFGVLVSKAVDLFGFSVDALWCTCFQRLLIYLAFLLMLFGVLVSKGF